MALRDISQVFNLKLVSSLRPVWFGKDFPVEPAAGELGQLNTG